MELQSACPQHLSGEILLLGIRSRLELLNLPFSYCLLPPITSCNYLLSSPLLECKLHESGASNTLPVPPLLRQCLAYNRCH